jgi:hypothetical protein
MGERWVTLSGLVAIALVLVLCTSVSAHKLPITEYTYVGHLWEASYTNAPKQPVENDRITFLTHVQHPGGVIDGNVTVQFSIYDDSTTWGWFDSKSYKQPNWQLLKKAWGHPTGNVNEFSQDIVIDRAGSYVVLVDYYENGQYIGQGMHTLDIEQRTVGPLFLAFSAIIITGVLVGVKKGVL